MIIGSQDSGRIDDDWEFDFHIRRVEDSINVYYRFTDFYWGLNHRLIREEHDSVRELNKMTKHVVQDFVNNKNRFVEVMRINY